MPLIQFFRSDLKTFAIRVVDPGSPFSAKNSGVNTDQEAIVEFFEFVTGKTSCPETGVPLGEEIAKLHITKLRPITVNPYGPTKAFSVPDTGGRLTFDGFAMTYIKHAVIAAGYFPSPDGLHTTWVSVAAEIPVHVNGTHVAWSPVEDAEGEGIDLSKGASAWAKMYRCEQYALLIDQENQRQFTENLRRYKNGEVKEIPILNTVEPVFVSDDGDIFFVTPDIDFMEHKTKEELYADHGLEAPSLRGNDISP